MKNVLRFVRLPGQQQQQRLTQHIHKNKSVYCNRLHSWPVPLQLRYTSTMAEKQNSEGIIEKVKNLALGCLYCRMWLIIGETSGKVKKEGDASQQQQQQKKDKKKDKKPGGASQLEVFFELERIDWLARFHHVLTSSIIVSKSSMSIGQNIKPT